MRTDMTYTQDQVPAPLLRWSAVLGGLILGLAILLLLSALWLALAYGSELTAIRDNLGWYIGISAVASLFVAGILTGYLSGVRGTGPGMLHGFTLWGLLMLAAITVGVPSLLNVFGLQNLTAQADSAARLANSGSDGTLWITFWTLLGGFVAARVANQREYYHGLLTGIVVLVIGELMTSLSPEGYPLAYRIIGDLLVIPAAMFGAHLRKAGRLRR